METQISFIREDLLTPDDVATILGVKRTTALGYMRRGVIPAGKIGRRWYSSRPLLDEYLTSLFSDPTGV
jgi:excisionase family DNA binding protein